MKKFLLIIFFLFGIIGTASAQTTVFTDNFSDGNISDWNQAFGTWTGANLDLNGGSATNAFVTHPVVMASGQTYIMDFQIKIGASNSGLFLWFFQNADLNQTNGYDFFVDTANAAIRTRVAGSPTNVFTTSGGITAGSFHDVRIIHHTNGLIQLFVDGTFLGSGTDTTYTSGNRIGYAASGQTIAVDNIDISYNDIATVEVLRPIDEKTLLPILEPWSVSVSGTTFDAIDNNSNSKLFIIPKVEGETANFLVDDSNNVGTDYFARNYAVEFEFSDSNSYTIQPYLISVVDGLATNFTIKDKFTFATIPGILLTARTGLSGTNTIVEQQVSNAAGIAQFIFVAQRTYTVSVEDINRNINYVIDNNGEYQAVVTGYTIEIPFTSADQNFENYDINLDILPHKEVLTGASQRIDVNVFTNYADNISVQVLDGNRIVDTSSTTQQDLNYANTFTLSDFNTFLIVRVTVDSFGSKKIYTKTYSVLSEQPNLIGAIQGFKNEGGTITGLIITVIGLLLVLQAFGPSIGGNNETQLFLTLIVLTIFSLFFFYNPNPGPNEPDLMQPLYAGALFGIIAFWYFKRS